MSDFSQIVSHAPSLSSSPGFAESTLQFIAESVQLGGKVKDVLDGGDAVTVVGGGAPVVFEVYGLGISRSRGTRRVSAQSVGWIAIGWIAMLSDGWIAVLGDKGVGVGVAGDIGLGLDVRLALDIGFVLDTRLDVGVGVEICVNVVVAGLVRS